MASNEIQGRGACGSQHEQANIVKASEKSGIYTSTAPSVTVTNGASNTALTSLQAAFFTPLSGSRANFIEIFSTQAISVRFRTIQNAATATASLAPVNVRANTLRTFDYIADCTEIYFTNASGSNASVEVVAI